MQIIKQVKRSLRIYNYLASREKYTLDLYMKKVRRMEPLTDTEWSKVKELCENEKQIYSNT